MSSTETSRKEPCFTWGKWNRAKPALLRAGFFSTAFSLFMGSVPEKASSKNISYEIWFCRCHWLVYLCLRLRRVCLSPYSSLAGLFGYLHKYSTSALILILWKSFYLSVMLCSRAMKTQKDCSYLVAI